jgi:N-methylhydantoinase A
VEGQSVCEAALDMRFVGQEYTLTVPVRVDNDRLKDGVESLRTAFIRDYQKTFGHAMTEPIEIVSVRATLRTPLPQRAEREAERRSGSTSNGTAIDAYSFTLDGQTEFQIVEREALGAGSHLMGPAIVLEPTAITYLDVGFSLEVDRTQTLLLTEGRS